MAEGAEIQEEGYKPMSDLYLVYTDNYFTSPFLKNKNRAIVFKLNYWLNI